MNCYTLIRNFTCYFDFRKFVTAVNGYFAIFPATTYTTSNITDALKRVRVDVFVMHNAS